MAYVSNAQTQAPANNGSYSNSNREPAKAFANLIATTKSGVVIKWGAVAIAPSDAPKDESMRKLLDWIRQDPENNLKSLLNNTTIDFVDLEKPRASIEIEF